MKKSLLILLFCGSLLFIESNAVAQNSGVGIGAIINAPTGLSAKIWVNDNFAVDGAFSFSISENFSSIYLHGDALKHDAATDSELLQLYYGLGLRLLWNDLTDDVTAGLRGPLGAEYTFDGTDFKSFIEISPTIDFTPDAGFFFTGAIGLRYYLN